MIVPKVIAGYIGHRWPRGNDVATKSYVDGVVDKIWLPSVTELNVEQGEDWNSLENDDWTNTNDKIGSSTFEYFKRFKGSELSKVLTSERTVLAGNGKAGNYSIPVYKKGSTEPIENISENNISTYYWTRSIPSYWHEHVRVIRPNGLFSQLQSINSTVGIRPCVTLKY